MQGHLGSRPLIQVETTLPDMLRRATEQPELPVALKVSALSGQEQLDLDAAKENAELTDKASA